MRTPSIEDLHGAGFDELAMLRHQELVVFAREYYWQRKTWFTRMHYAAVLVTLAAIPVALWRIAPSLGSASAQFGIAFAAFLALLLPVHELLHAIAYRLIGARDLRWNWSRQGLAVYVLAHRDVVRARPFVFVALVPFVVINAALIACTVAWPQYALAFLIALFLHVSGCAGDWALLNFLLLHRMRDVYTYDDAIARHTLFFARRESSLSAEPAALPPAAHV
jgi:hypothetical protein